MCCVRLLLQKEKKCRGQQTDSISLLCFTKDGMCCQTVKTYTSRIVIGPPCEALHRFNVCHICVQACVWLTLCICVPSEWLYMYILVCVCMSVYAHVLMCVYFISLSPFACVWMFVCVDWICLLRHSDPFYWCLQLLFCMSVDLINGNMLGQEEKNKTATLHEAWWRLHCPGRPLRIPMGSN